MSQTLIRVGTLYLPVTDVERSAEWYVNKLNAQLTHQDEEKAILNLADVSIFLVKSPEDESANFVDAAGHERCSMTFEVDGYPALQALRNVFLEKEVEVGEIENRGHAGRNFIFKDPDGNKFDVWSELSRNFKRNLFIS
jgi:catechol-2,3-dioxygenase